MPMNIITCGCPPGRMLKVLSVIDLVIATLLSLGLALLLTVALVLTDDAENDGMLVNYIVIVGFHAGLNDREKIVRAQFGFIYVFILIGYMLEVFLFRLIRSGVDNENIRQCMKWFIIRLLLLYFQIAVWFLIRTFLVDEEFLQEVTVVPEILLTFSPYVTYELIVLVVYVVQLKTSRSIRSV